MAEMDTSSGGGHKGGKGVKKGKKLSTRVDLTPMVDLGFLLITFFIFATTLTTPKAAKFRVPTDEVDDKDKMNMLDKAAITALFGPDEKAVYFYRGTKPDDPVNGIKLIPMAQFRKAILDTRKDLIASNIPDSVMNLSIKALPGAKYGTFMDVYDEVQINVVKNYVKVKPDSNEVKVIVAYNEYNKIPALPKTDEEAAEMAAKKKAENGKQ